MKKILSVGLMIVMLSSVLFLAGCRSNTVSPSTINVGGHADLTVAPDNARIYAGISIVKPTANEAQNEVNTIINAIVDGLRSKGISEEDIETESLNLYEDRQWIYDKEEYMPAPVKEVSLGWKATQILKIKTDELDKVGEIVDVLVENGANQINSIEFYLSADAEEDYRRDALAQASINAKKKAEDMADSLGVSLKKILSASETNYGYIPYRYPLSNNVGVAAVQESANVLPQDVSISSDVMLVYEIK